MGLPFRPVEAAKLCRLGALADAPNRGGRFVSPGPWACGNYTGDVFAVPRDRYFLALLDEVAQMAELVFASKAPTTFTEL